MILFGIGSILVIEWLNPIIFKIVSAWSDQRIVLYAVLIFFILCIDNFVSYILMNIVKKEIDVRYEDNTEEISRKVHELLKNHSLLIRRINEAYPNLQARPTHLTKQLREAKQEVKAARQRVENCL